MKLPEYSKFNPKIKLLFIFVFCLFFMCGVQNITAQKKVYTVVLDAGHGGKDPGNLGNRYKEKEIALKVTLFVGAILKKNKDIRVVYTREEDVFVKLHKRARKANEEHKKAKEENEMNESMFISFHCDSHTSKAYGVSTFVSGISDISDKRNLDIAKKENSVILLEEDYKQNYNYEPNSPKSTIFLELLQEESQEQSKELATLIQDRLVFKLKRHNRNQKQNDFLVLRNTVMPSVLIELGFLTNKKEGKYLNSKKGQREMAESIAISIEEYINQLKLNTISINVDKKEIVVNKKNIVQYKIRIALGKRKVPTKPYNFKGLRGVERIKKDSFYRYYYGKTTEYNKAKSILKKTRQKGYKGSFITAFRNGKEISVKEALKNEQR